MSTPFFFGRSSKAKLIGVHPLLVQVVNDALTEHTKVDFSVVEGVRSAARQAQLRASGASRIKVSKHQVDTKTGYGHAVDLVPWVGGRLQWELVPQCEVAHAMAIAAGLAKVKLRWGGTWSQLVLLPTPKKQVADYIDRCRAARRMPFVDAWHFEVYP